MTPSLTNTIGPVEVIPQRGRKTKFAVVIGIAAVLVLVRWGTFETPPAWDSAMSVWPAAIEISSDWDLGRVLALPTYLDGGPNTHTLSLVTLSAALSMSVLGPDATYLLFHILGIVLAMGLGVLVSFLVGRLGHQPLAPWALAATSLFPLVVSQSAYLYTELPSAFLLLAAAVLSVTGRPRLAALSLLIAVMVKPLAVIAIPALMYLQWRGKREFRPLVWPAVAVLGVLPALLVPQSGAPAHILERMRIAIEFSWVYLTRSPEIVLLFVAVPVLAGLVFHRWGASPDEWTWFWMSSILIVTFVLFFAANGVLTAGYFFLPRYALYVVPFAIVLAFLLVARMEPGARVVVMASLIGLLTLGARGPLAWGGDSPVNPLAERSLAFVERVNEQRAGLARLGELSQLMPIFYDHQSHYGYTYPELKQFDGSVSDGTAVSLVDSWGVDLSLLPDRFAMLVAFPMLGGELLRQVEFNTDANPDYTITKEVIGSADTFPVEVIIVERIVKAHN